jgi:hypothetical protein
MEVSRIVGLVNSTLALYHVQIVFYMQCDFCEVCLLPLAFEESLIMVCIWVAFEFHVPQLCTELF